MLKLTLRALLFPGIANPSGAATPSSPIEGDKPSEPQQHWNCFTASDARMRNKPNLRKV